MSDDTNPARRAARHVVTALALACVLTVPRAVGAQIAQPTAAQPTAAPPGNEALKQHEQELEAARASQRDAAEREKKLKADIAAIGEDRARLNKRLIDMASAVRMVETKIGETEARLKPLDARESRVRATLESRRGEIVEVLAALQRVGRRAPPALLVRPEDALQSLRSALLLGAVVPEMRARADLLVKDLTKLTELKTAIAAERDRLAADRDRLATDRAQLSALIDERQSRQTEAEKELDAEHRRATALAREADNLQELIAKMEADLRSAAKAAEAASRAPPAVNGKPNLAALKDPGRMTPAIAFAAARGLLALPVNGTKIREFGASNGAGGAAKGISIATRAGAQITTPCDGWVVYAGPFRSYGQLLILNAGGGYHVLLAGMDRISVNIGQFVLTGEPVATMGTTSQVAALLATAPEQPVLYIEFRKDGTPIDSRPWWASGEGEKVRG